MKRVVLIPFLFVLLLGCKNDKKEPETTVTSEPEIETTDTKKFEVHPISHATMILEWDEHVLYIDPVGGEAPFDGFPAPDLILITDIHGDHLNVDTLFEISTDQCKIIVPQAVADKLPEEFDAQVDVLNNGDTKERFGFNVEAIPMYNLREEALKFHDKGRGNGYVIEKDGVRIYISGDTEDIPEMRALQNIDKAFVCMNLPYTMTVESAADAVLDFKPKTIYPYHYRGTEGLSDVAQFKTLVSTSNPDIEVIQLDWYLNQ